MGERIVVYGCGGHARSIISTIREKALMTEIIVVDENARKNERIMDCEVRHDYELQEGDHYIIAIGDNAKRKLLAEKLKQHESEMLTVISEHSLVREDIVIGKGTFVAANVYIGPQVMIGKNSIINTACVIEHESVIGENTHIAPNSTICGRTQIGNDVFCGAGSTIIDNIKVCDKVIIGAGAVVIEDITEPGVYVGVPAKRVLGEYINV